MESSSPSDSGNSPLKRLLEFLKITSPPDTAEDIEQEIQEILDEGEEQGLIGPAEGQMISSIMEFRDTLIREVMTPRSEMVTAEAEVSAAALIQLITDEGFTRIPIYKDSPDNIIGILHAKDLLPFCLNASAMPAASELVKPAFFALDTRKIVNLLKDFQTQKIHMAIVTDEFGSVRGLITLEDVLEEIVGEIRDEYDKPEKNWKVISENILLADAKIDIEEVEDFFKIDMPEGPYESVGGLIINYLDRVPTPGTTMLINSLVFEVVSADQRRISTVKIQRKPK
ncbi:MAG: hemolysin family protein [Desulfobulbaceae bacterium]|nr:hemolysin family protein [Desulfobulbaceae bacterium]HIJ78084.1 HlyC/CorC family transporter [Deltaproteobacteria bacterium]